MSEEQLRELLGEMRQEPVPADSLVRMRSRIAEGAMRRRLWKRLRVASLIAIPACMAMLTMFLRRPAEVVALPPISWQTPGVPPEALAPAPDSPETPVPSHRRSTAPIRRQSRGAAEIRIVTADPDIVIILTGERSNGKGVL